MNGPKDGGGLAFNSAVEPCGLFSLLPLCSFSSVAKLLFSRTCRCMRLPTLAASCQAPSGHPAKVNRAGSHGQCHRGSWGSMALAVTIKAL